VEAITFALMGGIIGIVTGLSASALISFFARWSTVVSPMAIALAFGFSAMIGIFFGWYPAKMAASLDPIVALRYE
jgi:putative ABC transport system permease protein